MFGNVLLIQSPKINFHFLKLNPVSIFPSLSHFQIKFSIFNHCVQLEEEGNSIFHGPSVTFYTNSGKKSVGIFIIFMQLYFHEMFLQFSNFCSTYSEYFVNNYLCFVKKNFNPLCLKLLQTCYRHVFLLLVMKMIFQNKYFLKLYHKPGNRSTWQPEFRKISFLLE